LLALLVVCVESAHGLLRVFHLLRKETRNEKKIIKKFICKRVATAVAAELLI
jgi:hypothetical protein